MVSGKTDRLIAAPTEPIESVDDRLGTPYRVRA
jgi:hypothetical protein